ncbi:ComEC family competence protein [Patescibacteria group bacterium]|nr:ComEC family competence protein [Patescibacteria group bacterium]
MNKSKLFFLGFCLILIIIIFWRYDIVLSDLENSQLKNYNDSDEEIVLTGKIIKEPDVRENNIKLTILTRGPSSGRILVTVGRYPEYGYGDELEITGKLQTPTVFEDFNYKKYLLKDGIVSVSYYPKIKLLEKGRGPTSILLKFKDRVRQGIYRIFSPPQSEILGAMMLGDKGRMSLGLKEKLNVTGIRHITAISGLHIFILSTILMSLLLGLGLSRSRAPYVSLGIIFLFIAMIGFQPSSVRAGIMGGLFVLAQAFGRKSVGTRAIILTAGIMLLINPLLLFYDIGFQLSFLAVLGIITLAPYFKKWVKSTILATTLSAYIFTLPILFYNFGRISLIGPLVNILVIPVVYWIMILGLAFSILILIFPLGAWLISFPLWLLITYITKIVDFFS